MFTEQIVSVFKVRFRICWHALPTISKSKYS